MPAVTAGTIGTSVLLGLGGWGATSAVQGMKKDVQGSAPRITPSPSTPTAGAAEESAQRAVELKRRIRARTGGKTLLTQEGYLGAQQGSGLKTLLGG